MAVVFVISAVFAALLLSPTGAGADKVTWPKCKEYSDYRGRVLEASPDSEATRMNLDGCHLTEVRSGDYEGLPNVDEITLYHNSIAHVDPAAFRTVPKLRRLDLSYNAFREAPVFDEHSFFPSLTRLDLSRNRITEISHPKTFSGCTELQDLDISINFIEYIHADVFRPLSNLTFLAINNNKITTIPETLFINNNKLSYLHLSENKFPYLPSDFVSKLRSAGAPLKQFYLNDNPWRCACLLELLADVNRAGGVESLFVAPLYTEPVCVYDGPYPCSRQVPTGLPRRAAPGGGPLALANAAP